MTIKKKLLIIVILPLFTCTAIAVIIASLKIRNQGIEGLKDKSSSILSVYIQEYLLHHQDGSSEGDQGSACR